MSSFNYLVNFPPAESEISIELRLEFCRQYGTLPCRNVVFIVLQWLRLHLN